MKVWQVFAVAMGGAWLWSKQRTGELGLVTNNAPRLDARPFFSSSPSTAGSRGSGETNPLAALFGALAETFGGPGYVPLSGPGGATVDPGGSPSPSGVAANTLLPAAPGTQSFNSPIQSDVANLADPQYWWMGPAVDVAIMRDDVSSAMALAAQQGDISPDMVEAATGMAF